MSAADVAHLVVELGAVQSGVAAAIAHGELLQAEGAGIDLYVSRQLLNDSLSVVAAVEDPLGSIVLRVVSDGVWPDAESMSAKSDDGWLVAPPAAAALDLMDSGDPRHWVAAENLVKLHG